MIMMAGTVLIVLGLLFFLSGTVGLLRFPDVFTRLHALSKADTLALGLVCAGLALHADDGALQLKLLLIWLLVIVSGATCSSLIARAALAHGIRPWQR
ncbi:MAG: monovalent cation/H(+) antiporter subunit G [Gammaproteobacteria bacterium]|nr:MAG: monovalent cation/H(+) antiporter subunit G [Gammaproteobacteria bacterium]